MRLDRRRLTNSYVADIEMNTGDVLKLKIEIYYSSIKEEYEAMVYQREEIKLTDPFGSQEDYIGAVFVASDLFDGCVAKASSENGVLEIISKRLGVEHI